jgi:HD-like signal output (HDOD) protein
LASIPKKREIPDIPEVFKGFTEKELVEVYSIGTIRKMDTGDVLIAEGNTDRTVYVILEGSVRVEKYFNNRAEEIAILSRGSCVGEIAAARESRRTASVIAIERLKVMAIEESALNTLSPSMRLTLSNNLSALASLRIDSLAARVSELSGVSDYLISYIRNSIRARSDLYANSSIIRTILKSFPRLPMYATKLTELLVMENVSLEEIMDFARHDPSLVSVVLKTANSPYYNFPSKIVDFQHALLLLGFNQIYQIVVNNGISNIMPKDPEFSELQGHAILIALISFEIALLCGMKRPMIMNTLGLLHAIGKGIIMLLKKDFKDIAVLLDMLDDAKVASLLLEDWLIPDILCRSIEYHRYPEFSPPEYILPEYREPVAILHLAHLCNDYLLGNPEGETPSAFTAGYLKALNINVTVPELVTANIVPSLQKKMDTFPEMVRKILSQVNC